MAVSRFWNWQVKRVGVKSEVAQANFLSNGFEVLNPDQSKDVLLSTLNILKPYILLKQLLLKSVHSFLITLQVY